MFEKFNEIGDGQIVVIALSMLSLIILFCVANDTLNQHLDRQVKFEALKVIKTNVELKLNSSDIKELLR